MALNLPGFGPDHAIAALAAGIGVGIALGLHRLAFTLLKRLADATPGKADDIVVARLRRPSRWALAALGIVIAAREMPLLALAWAKVSGFVMPALIGWMVLAILQAVLEAAALPSDHATADDVRARRRATRLAIFGRIATFVIVTLTVGLMLLSIPGVREIGITLMASAGLGALAVGAAAQPALKSLIAGLQMALTEPIRIDDLVTIDGETGRVEDIQATYVVVRIWDDRRMIVPSARFLDATFVSATRNGSASVGTVMLYVRPDADVAAIRAAFLEKLGSHPQWDGRKASLAVTNTTIDSTEIRLVMSGRDPGATFDLRCAMREAMLAWLRDHQPLMIGSPITR